MNGLNFASAQVKAPPSRLGFHGLEVLDADAMAPENLNGPWPGIVPAGRLSVFSGDQEAMSTLATHLAIAVTTGRPCPHNLKGYEPGRVVMLAQKSEITDAIRPRFIAGGGDLARLTFLPTVKRRPEDPGSRWSFDVCASRLQFADAIASHPDTRLAIVDYLSIFYFYYGGNSIRELRNAFDFYSQLAAIANVGLVFLDRDRTLTASWSGVAEALAGIPWRIWDVNWAKRTRKAPEHTPDPWAIKHKIKWGNDQFLMRSVNIPRLG